MLVLLGDDIGAVTAAGGAEVHSYASSGSTQVVLISQAGGELSFQVAVADTTQPPTFRLEQVAGPDDALRTSLTGYGLEVRTMSGRVRRRARAFGASLLSSMALVAVVAIAPTEACAQDIETVARQRGIQLPEAYFQQLREDPTAYEFTRALFRRGAPARTASEGVVTLPVVLALFSDSPSPHITRDMIDASLFTGPATLGTVSEAYLEMSRGALDVRGDVFPWVRSSYTLQQVVGTNNGLGVDTFAGEYFVEALDSLDADVDWAQYDNDGPDGIADSGDDDGYVDVVTFEFLEVAASCGGPAIWPHRWTIAAQTGDQGTVPPTPGGPFITDDPSSQDSVSTVRINDYITQSVSDCTGLVVQDASTIAHEFGHALGLPDYYHPTANGIGPEGRRWVIGCWGLMAGGAWGCGRIGSSRGAFGPTHMMAHSKEQLGWIDYFDIGEVWNEEVVLDPVQTSGLALRIPMGDQGTEYFIAEYRARTGFDAQLPADGVLMYKLDETAARRPDPAGNDPYFLTLLEQDGDRGLVRNHLEGGDRGVAGDAWGVGGVSSKLNAESVPELRLSSGGRTPVTVHEVYVEGGQARLVISTGQTPLLIEPDDAFEVTPGPHVHGGGTHRGRDRALHGDRHASGRGVPVERRRRTARHRLARGRGSVRSDHVRPGRHWERVERDRRGDLRAHPVVRRAREPVAVVSRFGRRAADGRGVRLPGLGRKPERPVRCGRSQEVAEGAGGTIGPLMAERGHRCLAGRRTEPIIARPSPRCVVM